MTVEECLSDIEWNGSIVPFSHLIYGGASKTYLTYYTLADKINADDSNQVYYKSRYLTVDVFSESEPESLVNIVIDRLMQGSFTVTDTGAEQYEDDTSLYHTTVDFYTPRI